MLQNYVKLLALLESVIMLSWIQQKLDSFVPLEHKYLKFSTRMLQKLNFETSNTMIALLNYVKLLSLLESVTMLSWIQSKSDSF